MPFIVLLGAIMFASSLVDPLCAQQSGAVKTRDSKQAAIVISKKADVKTPSDISLKDSAIFFASVAQHVMEHYVEKTSNEELLSGALNGMLTALDPHSSYLDQKKYKDLKGQTKGEFAGLGIEVTMKDGLIEIISPLDDTPAYKAGLKAGDTIVRIGDKAVHGMVLSDAVELLKGPPGSTVELFVRREGGPDSTVKIERAVIKIHPVKWHLEGNVGYIRLSTFNEVAASEFKEAIDKIIAKTKGKCDGFVIDLRNNAGGLLDQAAIVADLFLDGGVIVSIKTRNGGKVHNIMAKPGDMMSGYPIAILVNSGSASASEIVSGAIQDHNRGIILGTKTFGKGSVQSVIPLTNGGAIKLTTAHYHTPSGRSIQKSGIDPDVVVQQAEDAIKLANDEKLIREGNLGNALSPDVNDVVGDDNEKDNPKKSDSKEKSKNDDITIIGNESNNTANSIKDLQLSRAVDIVRGMKFAQAYPKRSRGSGVS